LEQYLNQIGGMSRSVDAWQWRANQTALRVGKRVQSPDRWYASAASLDRDVLQANKRLGPRAHHRRRTARRPFGTLRSDTISRETRACPLNRRG
jgi:hypothetical protein